MSTRFDPIPGEPFGECETCGLVIETDADSTAHLEASITGQLGRSTHTVVVLNAPRKRRIDQWVSHVERRSVDDAVDEIVDAVSRGELTADEARRAWYRNELVLDEVTEVLS